MPRGVMQPEPNNERCFQPVNSSSTFIYHGSFHIPQVVYMLSLRLQYTPRYKFGFLDSVLVRRLVSIFSQFHSLLFDTLVF